MFKETIKKIQDCMFDVLAHFKAARKEAPTLFYELSRLALIFKNNQKMETTAVMLLNSLMEEKEKSSINLKCVSISLLKNCTFSGEEAMALLEADSTLLLDIIENESDLSLRMLAAEVLPKITSSEGLSQILSQMKSRLLSLTDSEDDKLIAKILSSNLLQLLSKKSSSDEFRLTESVELLLLMSQNIEYHQVYSLINLVCQKPSLQQKAVQVVLNALPRGFAMSGFTFLCWYILGEFGQSVFNFNKQSFADVIKLLQTHSKSSAKSMLLVVITSISKLWIKADSQSSTDQSLLKTFKNKVSQFLGSLLNHEDIEIQSRVSQYLFILKNTQLTNQDKMQIFANIPCKVISQDFDMLEMASQKNKPNNSQNLLDDDDLLGLQVSDNTNSRPAKNSNQMDDPLDLFGISAPSQNSTSMNNIPPKREDPMDLLMMGNEISKNTVKPQPITANHGMGSDLDLFMGVPIKPTNVVNDPMGLDFFNSTSGPKQNGVKQAVNLKNDELDMFSVGVDSNAFSKNQSLVQAPKKNENIGFDLEFL